LLPRPSTGSGPAGCPNGKTVDPQLEKTFANPSGRLVPTAIAAGGSRASRLGTTRIEEQGQL